MKKDESLEIARQHEELLELRRQYYSAIDSLPSNDISTESISRLALTLAKLLSSVLALQSRVGAEYYFHKYDLEKDMTLYEPEGRNAEERKRKKLEFFLERSNDLSVRESLFKDLQSLSEVVRVLERGVRNHAQYLQGLDARG